MQISRLSPAVYVQWMVLRQMGIVLLCGVFSILRRVGIVWYDVVSIEPGQRQMIAWDPHDAAAAWPPSRSFFGIHRFRGHKARSVWDPTYIGSLCFFFLSETNNLGTYF